MCASVIDDESEWIGYTFHYLAKVQLPPKKKIKEEQR